MLFADHLVVVLGGGDLATGAVARLHRAGFPVVVLELDPPLTVRRTVAVSTAITHGTTEVEDLQARRCESPEEAATAARAGTIAVMVGPDLPAFTVPPEVVVDARMAKQNLGTTKDDAPLVVCLGPGFTAGADCDAVVETMRGHHLGRVIWDGEAAPNTGVPGMIGGQSEFRVLRAETSGEVTWEVDFGEHVVREQALGMVGERTVRALTNGVVRGLIAPGSIVEAGMKIGDVDPRAEASACWEISDKALSVGGGVLEAVLTHLNRAT
jgi:xanthine dehydrogenase accessory factor